MVSQAFITACMAALMLTGSNASPCIPKSSSAESLTVSTSSATLSTAISSVETATSATSTEASESSTEASTISSSSTASTAVSSTESSTLSTAESSTESVTVSVSTAESSSTAEPSTTTSEAPFVTTYLLNANFDASPPTTDPWELAGVATDATLTIDDTVQHEEDGPNPNSAHIAYGLIPGKSFIRQKLDPDVVKAGVMYQADMWVKTDHPCSAYIECAYDTDKVATTQERTTQYSYPGWMLMSGECTYTQEQHDAGNLYLYIGVGCNFYSKAWFDSVEFGLPKEQPEPADS